MGWEGPEGPQGPKGDRGARGIMGLEGPQGPKGEKGDKGEKGSTGPRGLMGWEGTAGKDGKSGQRGPKGEKGDTGSFPDVTESVKESLITHEKKFDHTLIDPFLVGTKKIDESNIDKEKFIMFDGKKLVYRSIRDAYGKGKPGYLSAGIGIPVQSGQAGKLLTTDGANLSWVSSSSTVNFSDKEVPSGSINGINVTFTLAHTPTSGSEHVFLNGQLQTLTTDYTILGPVITFITAPPVGVDATTVLVVTYRY